MSIFRFKQFDVINKESAMKVNTDGVLLGAGASLDNFIQKTNNTIRVLDVGTGTGTIALMIAQRLYNQHINYKITGIDIDTPSIQEAEKNFQNSPWQDNLKAELQNLKDYNKEVDFIISNPPYFEKALQCPAERKRITRHSNSLSYRDLINYAHLYLTEIGQLSIILPYDYLHDIIKYSESQNLYLKRTLLIQSTPKKSPYISIIEFIKKRCSPKEEHLIIQDRGEYTMNYRLLIQDFYLWA